VNGRLIEYQIQERRPSWDVETERDAIFQSQMASYNSQLALYKSYQKSLAEWNKLDSNRRAQLQKRRQEIDNENAILRTQLAQLEKDRKDNRGGLVPVKKTIAELREDWEVVLNVQEAVALGKPHLALRPLKIDPWLISDEKNRLLRLSQGAIVK
jgi:chromosome segregation ATPase